MLKKVDGQIDWTQSAEIIERRVRAFHLWPSTYSFWNGQLVKVFKAAVVGAEEEAAAGEVVRADRGGLWIATGRGILSLEEVQLENRKRLPVAEFLKGAKIEKGERL